jgi:hypothetical protein
MSATGWAEFLNASDADMRRNDLHKGLTFTPDPNEVGRIGGRGRYTIDVVREYMEGFGHSGVGAREVVTVVGRDVRGVKSALAALVEDGTLFVREDATRGPRGSKRKVYFSRTEPVITCMPVCDEDIDIVSTWK